MNILIVDDNVPVVNGIKKALKWEKLSIEHTFQAFSMEQAQEVLQRETIDLLVSDIEMPGGSGLDLIEWINREEICCVAVILSSFADFQYAKKAISLGVAEYLLKPVESEELEHAILKAEKLVPAKREQIERQKIQTTSDAIQKMKQYIDEHLSQEISRKELADFAGFNQEYLSTLFKKETGDTLGEYIQKKRLSMAEKLLAQTNLPISLISQNCGYETLSYFSTVFRQKMGISPREYRKQCTKEK
ncbi:MAG: response regulator [Lachnospiraceae bacterium]|nr:response regulator [Robinsoniella sp.]MDY3767973.1 response regulator [Lachnospiraceae bacterium]